MEVGERLRVLREYKNLSQGDIEKSTGLLRCYISRVENGHTVPSVETLEKFARSLKMPLYQIFYQGISKPPIAEAKKVDTGWGSFGHDAKTLTRFRRLLTRVNGRDRKMLMFVAQKMAQNR